MRSLIFALGLCLLATPAPAGEEHSITEEHLRAVSDAGYLALFAGCAQPNQTYTPEQIASGLRRHYQERRARMIDAGFTIVPDQGT